MFFRNWVPSVPQDLCLLVFSQAPIYKATLGFLSTNQEEVALLATAQHAPQQK